MTTAAAAEPTKSDRPAELQAPAYEIFIGLLAVISLFNLAISVLPVQETMKGIAKIVDVPLTFIFLLDFTSRLLRSHPKRVYFIEQRGWLDLLGSLPAGFRLFRIFRLVRVTRLLGEYGARNILRSFIKDRADNALLVVLFMVIVVLEFGSILVVFFEQQDRRLRRPVPGHDGWPNDGRPGPGDGRRIVRCPVWIPCQFLPGARQGGSGRSHGSGASVPRSGADSGARQRW